MPLHHYIQQSALSSLELDHSSECGPMMHVIHRHRSRSSVIHAKLYIIRMDNNDTLMDTSVCGIRVMVFSATFSNSLAILYVA
jgi:hypothetical protein